jgi:hypothetical protein
MRTRTSAAGALNPELCRTLTTSAPRTMPFPAEEVAIAGALTLVRLFSQLHVFLEPGELIEGKRKRTFYSHAWDLARPDSFELRAG